MKRVIVVIFVLLLNGCVSTNNIEKELAKIRQSIYDLQVGITMSATDQSNINTLLSTTENKK